MISTGTDIRPLECLLFMRDVRSRVYFEQMKGRGTRTIDDTELQVVTGDAKHKSEFIIVDAVGVTENDKTDSRPLERKRNVPLQKLLSDEYTARRRKQINEAFGGSLLWRRDAHSSEHPWPYHAIAWTIACPSLRELNHESWSAVQSQMIDAMVRLERAVAP